MSRYFWVECPQCNVELSRKMDHGWDSLWEIMGHRAGFTELACHPLAHRLESQVHTVAGIETGMLLDAFKEHRHCLLVLYDEYKELTENFDPVGP